jgi:hypothetical protein
MSLDARQLLEIFPFKDACKEIRFKMPSDFYQERKGTAQKDDFFI